MWSIKIQACTILYSLLEFRWAVISCLRLNNKFSCRRHGAPGAALLHAHAHHGMQITCRYITNYIIILLPIGHPHLTHT